MARFAGTALTDYFSTPDFTQVGKVGMQGQSMQRNAATKAEGLVHGAGINSMAEVAQAGFQADAIKAQGQAQGQASMASGIGSMVSGIAGGFGSMGSGGGDKSYGGTGGKYGSFQPGSYVDNNPAIG
tara:strand:+ start:90 stop:470 length:381 start_codon:yes stop_codon:yes gene_type:complete